MYHDATHLSEITFWSFSPSWTESKAFVLFQLVSKKYYLKPACRQKLDMFCYFSQISVHSRQGYSNSGVDLNFLPSILSGWSQQVLTFKNNFLYKYWFSFKKKPFSLYRLFPWTKFLLASHVPFKASVGGKDTKFENIVFNELVCKLEAPLVLSWMRLHGHDMLYSTMVAIMTFYIRSDCIKPFWLSVAQLPTIKFQWNLTFQTEILFEEFHFERHWYSHLG